MIRKIFAVIFIIVFLAFSIPAVFLFGFYRTALSQDFYKGPLLDEIYNKITPVVVDEFTKHDKEILSKYFTREELIDVFKHNVPQSVFANILQNGFLQLKAVLEGSAQQKIVIKFDDLKEPFLKLTDDLINILFTEKIKQCAKNEYPKMQPVPSCIPAGYDVAIYKKRFESQISASVDQIFKNIRPLEIDTAPIAQNVQAIQVLDVAIQAYFGMLMVLCAIIFLILWKPFSRGLKWLGTTFVLFAFNALVIYKAIPILGRSLVLKDMNIPPEYADEMQNIVNFIIAYYQRQIGYVCIAVFVAGVIMIFAGYFKKYNAK